VKYMFLLIGEEGWTHQSEDEVKADMEKYEAFDNDSRAAGKFVSGEGLQESATATTLRVRGGERLVSDGPFAETKEQVGGYYIVEADGREAVIELAKEIPDSPGLVIDIRELNDT
jgi:hypothetical protein